MDNKEERSKKIIEMPRRNEAKPIDVRFRFVPEAFNELEVLREKCKASQADTLRYSLRILQCILEEIEANGKILVQNEEGDIKELLFPFLPQHQALCQLRLSQNPAEPLPEEPRLSIGQKVALSFLIIWGLSTATFSWMLVHRGRHWFAIVFAIIALVSFGGAWFLKRRSRQ